MTLFWQNKRVLVTGHTGFKGSWLSLWLRQMGADVFGFALPPDTDPALFTQLSLRDDMDHKIGDIRNAAEIERRMSDVQPDVVFHLAAQPLVLEAFKDPVTTWQTNVMGSINVMEAMRALDKPCATVMVTTDKVYENREWYYPYRETDPLGGHDPYSSSKAAMEIAIDSWRKSFMGGGSQVRIASARAGNVIGGGDWSDNRIIPDLLRAVSAQRPLSLRNPDAIRPWQHVLDPLAGYILLAQRLFDSSDPAYQSSYNFGPEARDIRPVRALVDEALKHWPGTWVDARNPDQPHEAQTLSLTIEKARSALGFQPGIDLAQAVKLTMDWYAGHADSKDMRALTIDQIASYPLS